MNPTYPAIPKSGGLGFFPTGISCWRQKLLILPTFLVCCAHPARAELIQHLDATITSSVTEDGNGIVTQWSDLSGAGNHATPSVGTVSYPSTSLSRTGKPGLKFGPTRSSLELFSGAESDSWLNQSANPNGFCVLVAFKCDGFVNNWNDFIGNSSGVESGFGIRYSEAGNFAAYMMGTTGAGGTVAVNDTVVVGLNYNAISGSYTYWNSDNGFANVGNKVAGDFSNGNAVTLGSTTSSGRHINGVLYEVKVYDSALTSLEFETQRNSLVEKWIQAPTGEPPVPPGPGVPNVLQTANALLSDVGPAPGQFPRTVGLDFVNGYLILDSRGVAVGNSNTAMQVWDISNPSIPFEVPNTRVSIKNPMHTYTMFLPHHRTSSDGVSEFINHVRDPLNITNATRCSEPFMASAEVISVNGTRSVPPGYTFVWINEVT